MIFVEKHSTLSNCMIAGLVVVVLFIFRLVISAPLHRDKMVAYVWQMAPKYSTVQTPGELSWLVVFDGDFFFSSIAARMVGSFVVFVPVASLCDNDVVFINPEEDSFVSVEENNDDYNILPQRHKYDTNHFVGIK